MYQVEKETASMLTRDGVRLDADIYRPINSPEKLPVLLMRQPYGRAIASTVVYAHPRWYASQGYIVIIQDVRGRGTSQGEFELFSSEIEDGYDTVNWAANIEGSTGEVGMYGFSYQGMTQLYAAVNKPSGLKTICPAMIAFDLYSDCAYENGAFCYQLNLGWAIQLAAETARLQGDLSAYQLLYLASRNLPLLKIPQILEELLQKYCPSNFYYQWLNHPENDDYWHKLSPQTYWQNIDLPMLHIGGWFDGYLRGTWNFYQQISQKSQFQQTLIIGAWAHLPWGNTLGDRYYTSLANNCINEIQIAWFNKYLKSIESEELPDNNINLFEMNSNKWISLNSFDGIKFSELYLKSTGLANIRDDDGKLKLAKPEKNTDSEDILVHDFWRPVPSLGGHSVIPAGSFERSELDNRSDIITYTSDFLTEDLYLLGELELEIYASADSPTFDLSAVVSQVFPDGKVYNFTQGYIRVKQHNLSQPIKFKLQPTCIKIDKDTAIGLSLSASNFPAYTVNSGNVESQIEHLNLSNRTITLSIFSGSEYPSKLIVKTRVS